MDSFVISSFVLVIVLMGNHCGRGWRRCSNEEGQLGCLGWWRETGSNFKQVLIQTRCRVEDRWFVQWLWVIQFCLGDWIYSAFSTFLVIEYPCHCDDASPSAVCSLTAVCNFVIDSYIYLLILSSSVVRMEAKYSYIHRLCLLSPRWRSQLEGLTIHLR